MPRKKILVVDSDEVQRRLLNDILTPNGHRLLTAETGAAAIELARREKPDLILLDVRLPDISGLEVVWILRSARDTRDVLIAAITAQAMPGDEERLLAQGCDAYMAKPINVRDFLLWVETILARPRRQRRGGNPAPPLPPPGTDTRWTARKKAAVVIALRLGTIGLAEACARYALSEEELSEWQEAFDRKGVAGLYAKHSRRPPPGAK